MSSSYLVSKKIAIIRRNLLSVTDVVGFVSCWECRLFVVRLDVDQRRPSSVDGSVSGGGVESLTDAVQRELERDLVVQLQTQLHQGDITNWCS